MLRVKCAKCGTVFEVNEFKDLSKGCPKCGYGLFSLEEKLPDKNDFVAIKIIDKGVYKVNIEALSRVLVKGKFRSIVVEKNNVYRIIFVD